MSIPVYTPKSPEIYNDYGNYLVNSEKFLQRLFGENYRKGLQEAINDLDPTRNAPNRNGLGYFTDMFFNDSSIPIQVSDFSFNFKLYDPDDGPYEYCRQQLINPKAKKYEIYNALKNLFTDAHREFYFESLPYLIYINSVLPTSISNYGLREAVNAISPDPAEHSVIAYDMLDLRALRAFFSMIVSDRIAKIYRAISCVYEDYEDAAYPLVEIVTNPIFTSSFWNEHQDDFLKFKSDVVRELERLFPKNISATIG
jgi:hypothetical protein